MRPAQPENEEIDYDDFDETAPTALHRDLSVAAEWKVFDVSVENISLVTNYRSTFASELDRSGVDGLLRVLREKNQAAVARTQPASS